MPGLTVLVALASLLLPSLDSSISLSAESRAEEHIIRTQLEPAAKPVPTVEPDCKTTKEKEQITITCDYAAAHLSSAQAIPPIELNHASLSFATRDDNYMSVELVFTNLAKNRLSDARDVYLEIDDAAGHNCMRRLLNVVDFRKLVPSEPLKFSTHLLSGTFVPNRYIIYLWIPSSEPSLKFKPANNLLISSAGVADLASGLNKVAEFTVEREAPVGRKPQ